MKQTLLSILLFPLDLMYFTRDAGIVTWRSVRRLFKKEKLQLNHFCEGEDISESPCIVRSTLKYQNKWLVRLLAPCIYFKSDGKRRIGFCKCEEGYYRAPAAAPALFLLAVAFWLGAVFAVLRAVSSDPDNFGRNFVSTFNPDTLGTDDKEVDFLEQGDSRLNPERAERYYLSGVKFLDQQKYPNAQVEFKIAIQSNPTDDKLHFHLAKAYLGMGQLVQGEASIRKTLEYNPDHVEALLMLSELVQRREEVAEAREFAARALELDPDNLQAVRLNAGIRANAGDREGARELMDKLLAEIGDRPETLSFLARLELGVFQDADAARERLTAALEIDPDHIASLLVMINLHAQAQDLDKMNEILEQVLSLEPDNLQALRLEAEMILTRYGLPAGLRAYESLLTRFGGNLGLRLRHAELLLRSGKLSEGKNIALQLTASRVPQIERAAHWMLAQMYGQVRMHEDAVKHARSTLRLSPNFRGAHLFLAQSLLNLNRVSEAKREAEIALSMNPRDIQAATLLTQAMVRLGEDAEAIDMVTRLIEEYPDQDALKLRRIELRMNTPGWALAIPDSRELLEEYPDNAALKNNLAFLLARSGEDLDQAQSLVESLGDQFEENPVIMDTQAYVLAARGLHEEAIPIYEQALSKAGGNSAIRYHYARSLAAVGRIDDAMEHLKAVLIMTPDFSQEDEVRELMDTLSQAGA